MTDLTAMDAEANAFAMELLMPFDWIALDSAGIDLCDEDPRGPLAKLAKRYRVPITTMAVRIGEVRATMQPCRERTQQCGEDGECLRCGAAQGEARCNA